MESSLTIAYSRELVRETQTREGLDSTEWLKLHYRQYSGLRKIIQIRSPGVHVPDGPGWSLDDRDNKLWHSGDRCYAVVQRPRELVVVAKELRCVSCTFLPSKT